MRSILFFISIAFFCALPIKGGAQSWQNVGTGLVWASSVNDFYVDTSADLLYLAGRIHMADTNNSCPGIFAWNGTNYLPLGCGIDWDCVSQFSGSGPFVTCVTKYNNEIYVGGTFSSASGIPCRNIARWNGSTWDSVGTGLNNGVSEMRVINGELYVVGSFSSAGGVPVNAIAKWNGTIWSDVNSFPNYGTNLLSDVIEFNGELYVCGNFSGPNGCHEIVKWNGSAWVSVGGGFFGGNSAVETMCVYQNKLFVGGYFIKSEDINNPGNFVVAWDGFAWSDPAGGTFNPYSPLDNGQIHDMIVFHNELWITGTFRYAGGVEGCDVAKWDGIKWCTFDTINAFDARPFALAVYRDSLYLGGNFWSINSQPYLHMAKWNGGSYVDTCGQYYLTIEENANALQLSIFPNPTSEIINFQFSDSERKRTLLIYDQLGREIWREETTANLLSISVSDFADGIYFYSIQDAEGSKSNGKFVVVH